MARDALQYQGSRSNKSCLLCEELDTDEMVACDKCSRWYHFDCVGVGQSVENDDWMCSSCIENVRKELSAKLPPESMPTSTTASSSRSNQNRAVSIASVAATSMETIPTTSTITVDTQVHEISSKSSMSSNRRRTLKLQFIEEERKLQAERDAAYLKKKYEILEQQVSSEEEGKEDEADKIKFNQQSKKDANASEKVSTWLANTNSNQSECFVNQKNNGTNVFTAQGASVSTQFADMARLHSTCAPEIFKFSTLNNQRPITTPFVSANAQLNEAPFYAFHQNVPPVLSNPQPFAPQIFAPQPFAPQPFAPQQFAPQQFATQQFATRQVAPDYHAYLQFQPRQLVDQQFVHQQFAHQQFVPQQNVQGSFSQPLAVCHNENQTQPSRKPTERGPRSLNNSSSCNNKTSSVEETMLSHQKIAARNVVSKELPTFNGNPEDWPIFISCFENSTQICDFTHEENLIRIQKSLKGKAMEAVRHRLLIPSNVPQIIETLRMLFGRPEIIINALLEKVRKEPAPKPEKLETLISYSLSVENLCSTIEASKLEAYASNPILIQELVDKLPVQFKMDWAKARQSISVVTLCTFGSWLSEIARSASEVTLLTSTFLNNESTGVEKRKKGYINTHSTAASNSQSFNTAQNSKESSNPCYICKKKCSSIVECKTFNDFNHSQRWEAVKENNLCRKCLKKHKKFQCRVRKICGRNGCEFKHHQLLHNDAVNNDKAVSSDKKEQEQPCMTHQSTTNSVLFRILPVILHGNNTSIQTYAFLDEGSSITLIENSVVESLNLTGEKEPLCLKWTGGTKRIVQNSKKLSLEISCPVSPDRKYRINNAYTVDNLNLPEQSIDAEILRQNYSHLKGIPIGSYHKAVPLILIGLDNINLGMPIKIKEGSSHEPVASKTRLGWSVYGPTKFFHNSSLYPSMTICQCNMGDDVIHTIVKNYFSTDCMEVNKSVRQIQSADDERAISILESSTKNTNGHFETGLLWKFDEIQFPNNFGMAKQRLECLEKRLVHDKVLHTKINEMIHDYETKGYVEKLSHPKDSDVDGRTWYLPVFPITNPNKPAKLRLVWDAAATFKGTSLNSMLMKGPDNLSPLLPILMRFREKRIAICADIREMYHQVFIKESDRQSQRFLWRNEPTNIPDIYEMKVMTFGSTCSPCCAQFIKNRNAMEFVNRYPRAVKAICENHYVDDLLDSVDTENEAITLANEVKLIHGHAGFTIRNFVSNSKEVMTALGEYSKEPKRDLNLNAEISMEKVLGMWWSPTSDIFTFSLIYTKSNEILKSQRRPTKRELLRLVMSIFDPMGLLSHFLIYIKIVLQQIWRYGLNWDDELNDELNQKWIVWRNVLPEVEHLQIERQYFPHNIQQVSLHIFVDASENAFAAAAYFRVEINDSVNVTLVSAKSRVAPIKIVSIPRLELQAAVLGTRLAKMITTSHTFTITSTHYWSDSRTVISWIKSDQRRYKQYVAHRVSEILESTEVTQWKWISTKFNVADDATKWQGKFDLSPDSRWFRGPPFLRTPENEWPNDCEIFQPVDEELRTAHQHHHQIEPNIQLEDLSLIPIDKYSWWQKLLRITATVLRVYFNFKATKENKVKRRGPLQQIDLIEASNYLFKQAQTDTFSTEIAILAQSNDHKNKVKCLPKSSSIYKLSPYVDDCGVLRVHGRIDAINYAISEDTKRPIILPRRHRITELIMNYYHVKYHHHNFETTINEIRQKFYIPKVRASMKSLIRNCNLCKIQRAKPQPPKMADLPRERLSPFTRPFTFIGIDCFGPLIVTVGRHTEKRYGVLITCLTTRSIHIEISYSLSTDSCIMCIRNFIARRGIPQKIFSDNGTNFRGAEKEMKIIMMNSVPLMEEFETEETKWYFNPPSCPHMGGCWERLVRSVKTTLYAITPTRSPSDELLRCMLMEVESVVNSRPLTFVPVDHESDVALTPNHFLLGTSNGNKPLGVFTDDGIILKKNWMKAQQYANMFWKKWIREYLPMLTRRTKWFKDVPLVKVGDIVIIVDETSPRNCWPKGRVIRTIAGKDQRVRRAIVQTSRGIYERPVVKLAVLDVGLDSSNESKPNEFVVPGENVVNAADASELANINEVVDVV